MPLLKVKMLRPRVKIPLLKVKTPRTTRMLSPSPMSSRPPRIRLTMNPPMRLL